MTITVHTIIDEKTALYRDRCWQSMRELASNLDDIHFVTHQVTTHGCQGHAIGIQAALRDANPIHINVIADADTVMLAQGWDLALIWRLNSGIDVFGTSFEEIGSHGAGSGLRQQYKKLPTLTWIAFAPRCPLAKLDPSPNKDTTLPIDNSQLARRYNLPIGYQLFCDVAWRLPEWLESNGLKSDYLRNTRLRDRCEASPGDLGHKVMLVPNTCSPSNELYLDADGRPFIAHQRSSSKIPFNTGDSKIFYDAVKLVSALHKTS